MKDIKAIKGKFLLRKLIAEGEHEHQDFKFQISDARKIARSISAFANNSGGRLLIGVKDNGTVAGVRNEEDIYVIEQAAQMYCRPAQKPAFSAFRSDEGAVVIKVDIDAAAKRPVLASEPDGTWNAYYRVADENIRTHPIMVKAWRRKASGKPSILAVSDAERQLLDNLAQSEGVDLDSIAGNYMMTSMAAAETAARLYSMGLADFQFINRRFTLVAAKPSQP